MWDSGRDYHPAGREVSREALQHKSSPRIVVGKKPLTGESSCQAGHMTCTRPQAERQILLATRASSTHDPPTRPTLTKATIAHRFIEITPVTQLKIVVLDRCRARNKISGRCADRD